MYLLERCSMGFVGWGVGAVGGGGTHFLALGLQALLCWGEGEGGLTSQTLHPITNCRNCFPAER